MALHEHHLLGQPIDKGKIGWETRNNFRKLLRTLPDTSKSDIDTLYKAIMNDEIDSF